MKTKICRRFSGLFFILCLLSYVTDVDLLTGGNMRKARENEFPSFASLVTLKPRFRAFCSGAIITGVHVLTSASCISKYPIEETRVYTGYSVFSSHETYHIDKWTTYSTWAKENNRIFNQRKDLDIAIIRMLHPFHFNESIGIALLPFDYPVPTREMQVSLVGWPSALGREDMSLMTEMVPIVPTEKCKERVYHQTRLQVEKEELFCTPTGPRLSKNDDGGPVYYKHNILVGITLWRVSRNDRNIVNLHINYRIYKDFIDRMISE